MQEKPPRNEAQQCLMVSLYGLMLYHHKCSKIRVGEIKNGQSTRAEGFSWRQMTDAGLKLSKLPFALTEGQAEEGFLGVK